MAIIYNDPGSGTFCQKYGSSGGTIGGQFTTIDTNWTTGNATQLNVANQSSGGNLISSVVASATLCFWNTGAWAITSGGWAEITVANQIGSSAAQVGPFVAGSTNGGFFYGYIIRLRRNGANNTWTVYSYNHSTATQVIAETTYVEPTAPYTVALQQVYKSASINTLTAFISYAQVGASTDDATDAATVDAQANWSSGLWPFNGVSGFGDIANMRGGTGLYPGNPASTPTTLMYATRKVLFFI